jgi:cell division inhibitor SepF
MLGDIKSKLGFGRKDEYDEYYDDYDEYADDVDYGEDGYDESYMHTAGSSYDPYDSVTTRDAGDRSRSGSSMPHLVSIDDVRARTSLPTLPRDEEPRRSSSSSSFRTMVDSSLPPQMTPEGTAAASVAASKVHSARSEGLNSLFESTVPVSSEPSSSSSSSRITAASFGSRVSSSSRNIKIIAPVAFNDVESVSMALKVANPVVLNLVATPDALAKRVLDFSFGVASALDAKVDCIGNKVFAITRFSELSESERSWLQSQGIL